MEVLNGLGVTICTDDAFLVDDTEGKHVDKLQKITERTTAAGLNLNLKKCQFGQFQVNYLSSSCLWTWDSERATKRDLTRKNKYFWNTSKIMTTVAGLVAVLIKIIQGP